MKPISEYQAMLPAQILEDPHAPETLKIRARNELQKAAQAHYELSEAERIERMAYEREAQEGMEADRQRTSC